MRPFNRRMMGRGDTPPARIREYNDDVLPTLGETQADIARFRQNGAI